MDCFSACKSVPDTNAPYRRYGTGGWKSVLAGKCQGLFFAQRSNVKELAHILAVILERLSHPACIHHIAARVAAVEDG